MSTAAAIQAVINEIADGELNTAAEVRDALEALKSEFFPATLTDTTAATLNYTNNPLGITFVLSFTKRGNEVTVSGYIKNTTALSIPQSVDVVTFKTAYSYLRPLASTTQESATGFLMFDNLTIKTRTAIPTNLTVRINETYKVAD